MSGLFTPQERLLTPPGWTGVDERLPVVYIGGPTVNTADFQTPLATSLIAAHEEVFVASSRPKDEATEVISAERLDWWENAYLGRAAFNGAILFWLAAQDDSKILSEQAYDRSAWSWFSKLIDVKNSKPHTPAHIGIDPDYVRKRKQDSPDRYFRYLARYAGIHMHDSIDAIKQATLNDLA